MHFSLIQIIFDSITFELSNRCLAYRLLTLLLLLKMSRLNKLVKIDIMRLYTVHPKKYAHDFVVLCFVVVMQSFIMNSHEVFIHIHQGCFAGEVK